jgi:hypothetical protein
LAALLTLALSMILPHHLWRVARFGLKIALC